MAVRAVLNFLSSPIGRPNETALFYLRNMYRLSYLQKAMCINQLHAGSAKTLR
jgi:hypothetical protein